MPDPALRCILIGGTSNAGKSTLAASWGAELGWPVMSTDSLGRHPGRPWASGGRDVPLHVLEHYRTLSDAKLLQSNLDHYRTMWPLLERLVLSHAAASLGRLVLEGSGCLPDEAARLTSPHVGAIWLIADDALIEERIRRESGYAAAGQRRPPLDRQVHEKKPDVQRACHHSRPRARPSFDNGRGRKQRAQPYRRL